MAIARTTWAWVEGYVAIARTTWTWWRDLWPLQELLGLGGGIYGHFGNYLDLEGSVTIAEVTWAWAE